MIPARYGRRYKLTTLIYNCNNIHKYTFRKCFPVYKRRKQTNTELND